MVLQDALGGIILFNWEGKEVYGDTTVIKVERKNPK